MERSKELKATDITGGETDMRKSWQTPAVITPTDVKEETGFNPGVAGDNFYSSNAVS
ncbi:MAG: hypothetical protein V4564_11620 [Pseudomonadota bacterium]